MRASDVDIYFMCSNYARPATQVEVPPELGNMTALQELWLYSNQLTAIPPTLGQLHKLKRLW
jgi:Leucine-rich repeat (LRR) protein